MKSTKIKRKFVNVTPKSYQAKIMFEELMNSLHGMEVKEETENMYHLLSITKRSEFWIPKKGNDHWKVEK
jgi:hypothetical protein